ncbi:hypothetical protein CMI37_20990 [Candidatus Pacearchaeota archaeon]|nr:hypothetical protein [Candidatus Pacearchaeota archaeon]|tara:strand:- start:504 stop:845 length:342 start_codon:yes stop_codon:yes gene_type:complete
MASRKKGDMKLPTKVRVNGIDWTIEVDELALADSGRYAETSFKKQTITLSQRYAASRVRTSLLHELIHVAEDTLEGDERLTETQISTLAAHLYEAIFVGNPEVLAFLSAQETE